MGEARGPWAARQGDFATRVDRSVEVHLLAGLPTEAVRRGFEQASASMPLVSLDGLVDLEIGDSARLGVVLPPFVEPSLIVESWEECDFLSYRFGRAAHVAGVSTFVDVDHVVDQLASDAPLSQRGWGRSEWDGRTVADIVVGQIESATRLVLVGDGVLPKPLSRWLAQLNPAAHRASLRSGSRLDRTRLALLLHSHECEFDGEVEGRGPSESSARSAQVVPPWLEVLRSGSDPAPGSGLLVYRRAHPFDAERLRDWMQDPAAHYLRGKGHLWTASEPEVRLGYSCAGSVHRLFRAGRWWASAPGGVWPSCAAERRRLFEQWHPRFGDRRQEIVFLGADVDPQRLFADLDSCLLREPPALEDLQSLPVGSLATGRSPSSRLH